MDVIAAVALDLGGTKVAAATITGAGEVLNREVRPTPIEEGADGIVHALASLAGRQIERALERGLRIEGVGVATGGTVDVDQGVVTHATAMLPGWQGLPLARLLGDRIGVPVRLENDAHAMALGEYFAGAAKGCRDVLCVTVGTGIGGAVIRDGRLRRGLHGMAGGVGHIVAPAAERRLCECGGVDHIESYASGRALKNAYATNAGTSATLSDAELASLAGQGDPAANRAIRDCAQILGRALGGLLNVLDVERVVVGGGVSRLGAIYLEPLAASMRKETYIPEVDLRPAALGPDAGLVGIGVTVLEERRGADSPR